jgi:hypothetical protein
VSIIAYLVDELHQLSASSLCITIIDTIILTNYTNDAYTCDTYLVDELHQLGAVFHNQLTQVLNVYAHLRVLVYLELLL